MRRWLWFAVGIVLGAVAGTGLAWSIRPAEMRGDPPSLQPVYRGEYILLIGSAYESTGNLARARERLAEFPELNPDTLASLAQQAAAAQGPNDAARGLARLSVDLRTPTPAAPSVVALAATDTNLPFFTPTREPTLALTFQLIPSPTAEAAPTATQTGLPKFALAGNEPLCESDSTTPRLEVTVRDAAGRGIPGVVILLQWPGGQDRFVTGMKPEIDPGYADAAIEADTVYQVLLNGVTAVRNIKAPDCSGAGAADFSGSIRLTFESR